MFGFIKATSVDCLAAPVTNKELHARIVGDVLITADSAAVNVILFGPLRKHIFARVVESDRLLVDNITGEVERNCILDYTVEVSLDLSVEISSVSLFRY